MRQPSSRKGIRLDSAAFMTQHAPHASHPPDAARAAAAFWLRGAWEDARARTRAALEEGASGKACMRDLSGAMDALLTGLWRMTKDACGDMPLALFAVGGYGRRELFLYSDVDVLLLLPPGQEAAPSAQWLLYALWDAGIKVSQQVMDAEQALALAAQDVPWCTSLLDMRLIAGESATGEMLMRGLREGVLEPRLLDFVEAKLAERDARHAKWGGSRYLLEPNLKDGKGGLRDLQTLYWLAKATHGIRAVRDLTQVGLLTGKELSTYRRAVEFFSSVRMHLHAISGRGEERLTFEHQRALASRLGFRGETPNATVERFMKRYFQLAREVGRLTRAVCAALEEEKKRKPQGSFPAAEGRIPEKPFALEGQRLIFAEPAALAAHPVWLVRLFDEARRTGRDIHPAALQQVAEHARRLPKGILENPEVQQAFWRVLLAADAELHLRRMNEAELLGRLIPDFGKLVGMMQFDRYHIYTVDEHILVAVGRLHAIAHGDYAQALPMASAAVAEFAQSRTLFLAMLCHDIAKGRGGNHPSLGAEIGAGLARQLGLDGREVLEVAWLIEHHQLLTDVAFKRDLQDPAVIAELAIKVQSTQRIRMLLLMTVADVLAVGPTVWNDWKATILRELVRRVEARLQGRDAIVTDEALDARAARLLPAMGERERMGALVLAHPSFWSVMDDAAFARVVPMVRHPLHAACATEWLERPDEGVAELIVHTPDRAKLFALLTGCLSASGANILRCRIHTLTDGTALDRFWLQNRKGEAFTDKAARKRLAALLLDVLGSGGEAALEAALAKARTVPHAMVLYDTPPSIYADIHASDTHTVLEIHAPDRVGLLHDLTQALSQEQANVTRAYIATYGEMAVDVFYVKDAYGFKIDHPGRLARLTEALRTAASGGG